MSNKIDIHSTLDQQHKCHFCGSFANYSLYLVGTVRELCSVHYREAGVKTVEVAK